MSVCGLKLKKILARMVARVKYVLIMERGCYYYCYSNIFFFVVVVNASVVVWLCGGEVGKLLHHLPYSTTSSKRSFLCKYLRASSKARRVQDSFHSTVCACECAIMPSMCVRMMGDGSRKIPFCVSHM